MTNKIIGRNSSYYQLTTGYGPLHIHINYDDSGIKQVFVNLPPIGTELSGLASLVGILITKYLEQGGCAQNLLKHLNSVKGDRPCGFGNNHVDSIAHAVSIAIREHLKEHKYETKLLKQRETDNKDLISTSIETKPIVEKIDINVDVSTKIEQQNQYSECCPECHSPGLVNQEGCVHCLQCNYSKCS